MVGAAVAVVSAKGIVHGATLGVRDLASGAPVTSDTHFFVGSTTKSMSTLLVATFVDDGAFTWDRPGGARGRTPDCHCFGQLHSTPAGWPTIARNSVLAVVAALVARGGWRDPGYSAIVWLTGLSGAEAGLLIGGLLMLGILAALGWIVVNLMSQHGRLLGRLESLEQTLSTSSTLAASSRSGTLWSTAGTAAIQGLPIGTSAPVFALPDLDGAITTLDTLRAAGAPVLLLFSDPACGPCNQLMREAGRWQREYVDQMAVVLVSRGSTREANLAKAREYGLERVLLQQDREVAQAYEAQRTPTAVIVRTDGTIGTALAGGIEAVRALVTSTLESGKIHHVSNGNPHVPSLIESWSR